MKKILLASTMLVSFGGYAAAEVAVSGSARMGVVATDNVTTFSSRVRMDLTGSGTTDGGLAFGGSFGVKDSQGANAGTSGSVFISGAFGKISMGDVDSGDNAAVGQLDGVGYTGLGSGNSINYAADGFDLFGLPAGLAASNTYNTYNGDVNRVLVVGDVGYDPEFPLATGFFEDVELTQAELDSGDADNVYLDESYTETYATKVSGGSPAKVLYTYSAGGFSLNASASQISNAATDFNSYGLGVAYTTGGLTLAAGYGSNEFGFVTTETDTITTYTHDQDGFALLHTMPFYKATVSDGSVTDASLSATYVMGDTTLKAIYQDKQMSATYQEAIFDGDLQEFNDSEDAVEVSGEAVSMGLSVNHTIGALSLTAFGVSTELSTDILYETDSSVTFTRTGIGASYDLGGGASVVGGVVNVETAVVNDGWELEAASVTAYDLGLKFKF